MLKKSINKALNVLGWEVRRTSSYDDFTVGEFERRQHFRHNYRQLACALIEVLGARRVLDVGSGNGFLIDALLPLGVDVEGIELSDSVRPLLSPAALERTRFADATRIGKIDEYDLVTCIEVAEHIAPERSAALIDVVAANTKHWIYLTAATPYQPGHGHINCRPHFFWIKLLHDRGFDLDVDKTQEVVARIEDLEPCTWLPLNSLVFRSRLASEQATDTPT